MEPNPHYEELTRQLKVVKDRVRAAVHGLSTGLYLHGRPGTSKTHTVRSTLEALGVGYAYSSGHLTPRGLFDLIVENCDRVIVLDDVTALFGQPVALQILLAALGSPHGGSGARVVKYKTAHGDRVVRFTGAIICISNLPLAGRHREALAALGDRVPVLAYEPSDEQVAALILRLAQEGAGGVRPDAAREVAEYLLGQCKLRGVRPSVRLFIDKALKDYRLFELGACETHWRDLVVSGLEQQLVELRHPTADLSRKDQAEAERRLALAIHQGGGAATERVERWHARTGKSQAAYYRRLKEAKGGLLRETGSPAWGGLAPEGRGELG
jgi:hypothetical protein